MIGKIYPHIIAQFKNAETNNTYNCRKPVKIWNSALYY